MTPSNSMKLDAIIRRLYKAYKDVCVTISLEYSVHVQRWVMYVQLIGDADPSHIVQVCKEYHTLIMYEVVNIKQNPGLWVYDYAHLSELYH